jgi:hypothetical protein
MKDKHLKSFFKDNTPIIEDKGFTQRLMSNLDYLPRIESKPKRKTLPVLLFSIAGIVLFVILGGYSILIDSMSSIGGLISGETAISPESVIPLFLLLCSMFAGGKYIIEEM